MKRIAIFCDGTWNAADAPHPTNVVKLAQAVKRTASDGTTQAVCYVQGVGTGEGTGQFSRFIDKVGGGAFGWGLTENIEDAYRALVFLYEPGDEIHIFGFSRGAYTARSLAGLIRSSGIADARHVQRIPELIERYRSRDKQTHPDDEESFRFRHELAPDLFTSEKEKSWREKNGFPSGIRLQLTYVGVWDTVGALGVPSYYGPLAKVFNKKYQFHDTQLSSSVKSARHAVAIDERRETFPAALWQNIDKLNATAMAENGDKTAPYQQLWFPGDHGSIGGGGDIVGLSDNSLLWIAEGAEAQGLEFLPDVVGAYRKNCDYRVSLSNQSTPPRGFFNRVTRLQMKDRENEGGFAVLSPAAVDRWHEAKENLYEQEPYRPGTLKTCENELAACRPTHGE
ncbi:DUF2235 domain-containing protein [Martelella alba]|nr:DUF2235 domain-containing protein [Martelella alba]